MPQYKLDLEHVHNPPQHHALALDLDLPKDWSIATMKELAGNLIKTPEEISRGINQGPATSSPPTKYLQAKATTTPTTHG
jgi:hypothetical protein